MQGIKRKLHIFLCRACLNMEAGEWSSFQHWLLWASWVHFERKGRIVLNMKLMNNLSSSQHIKMTSFEVPLHYFFTIFVLWKVTDCTKGKKKGNKKKDRLLYLERHKQKESYWQGLQNTHSYICKNDTIPFCPVFFLLQLYHKEGIFWSCDETIEAINISLFVSHRET